MGNEALNNRSKLYYDYLNENATNTKEIDVFYYKRTSIYGMFPTYHTMIGNINYRDLGRLDEIRYAIQLKINEFATKNGVPEGTNLDFTFWSRKTGYITRDKESNTLILGTYGSEPIQVMLKNEYIQQLPETTLLDFENLTYPDRAWDTTFFTKEVFFTYNGVDDNNNPLDFTLRLGTIKYTKDDTLESISGRIDEALNNWANDHNMANIEKNYIYIVNGKPFSNQLESSALVYKTYYNEPIHIQLVNKVLPGITAVLETDLR